MKTPVQTHAPQTPARIGGAKPKPVPKHTQPRPQPGMAGSPGTETQPQAPHNIRKPSVHSLGTQAAKAIQLTWPNVTRSPGVRLHPKACATLGLEVELATAKHLGTQVPRPRRWHALGTGCAGKSGEHLGFCPKEGTWASTGAQPPGVTSASRWRQSALPVLPRTAFLGATSQVYWDVSRLPSSSAQPLPVLHRGDSRGNQWLSLHNRGHLPTYLLVASDQRWIVLGFRICSLRAAGGIPLTVRATFPDFACLAVFCPVA